MRLTETQAAVRDRASGADYVSRVPRIEIAGGGAPSPVVPIRNSIMVSGLVRHGGATRKARRLPEPIACRRIGARAGRLFRACAA